MFVEVRRLIKLLGNGSCGIYLMTAPTIQVTLFPYVAGEDFGAYGLKRVFIVLLCFDMFGGGVL
jgi:hypothetical protein